MTEQVTILSQAFDTANEEGSNFDPIPAGSYVATVRDASVGALKNGKGQAVTTTWEIESGEYAGRLVWDRVIVAHESADAMKFGRRKFKDIADACGVTDAITDLSVICHKPCMIYVKIEEDDAGEYPPKNRVTRVKSIVKEEPKTNGGTPKLTAVKSAPVIMSKGKETPPIDKDMNDEVPF
jgi:hypothetical protein